METPTRRWRRDFEHFDRRLGFGIGAVVGFAILFVTVAEDGSGPHEAVVAGLLGGAVFGVVCALFGDRALWALARWFS
jgi:hypothetical protein